jgi:hypothetical protein
MKSSKSLLVIIVMALLAFEICVFIYPIQAYISLFHPRFSDQIQYLSESYLAYESSKVHGFIGGVWYSIINPVAQGVFHDLYAFLLMTIYGPSRVSALMVNLLAFVGWQAASFITVRALFRSNLLAIFSAIFILSISGIWGLDRPGSAFDYRLDHLAMCFMGIASMVQLRTNMFKDKKWSIIFGVITAITILTRVLTSVYFILIFLIFFVGILINGDNKKEQIKNIIFSATVGFVVAAPLIFFNIREIYEYYVVGHFTGGVESTIRDSGLSFFQKINYEFREGVIAFQGHWFYLIFLLAISPAILFLRHAIFQVKISLDIFKVGLAFIVAPLMILACEKQVSYVVLSILSPGLVLVLLSISLPLLEALQNKFVKLTSLWVAFLCALSLGIFTQNCLSFKTSPRAEQEILDSKRINAVVNYIYELALKKERGNLKIGIDRITDFMDAQILRVVVYEQRGKWFNFDMTLPTGLAEENDQLIFGKLSESDIVFLSDSPTNIPTYPFDKQMIRLAPKIREYCDENFVKVARLDAKGLSFNMYVSKKLIGK